MSASATDSFFRDTKPGNLFIRVAVPGALGMLASSVYYLLEAILIGRVLGAEPFAAMNLAMPFIIINFALSDLIGVGSAVPISIALGRGDKEEADSIFSTAIVMIILAGIAMGSVLFISAPWLFKMMGADEHLIPLASSYMRTYAIFSPFSTLTFAMDNYLKVSGAVKRSLAMNVWFAVIATLIEITFLCFFKWGIWAAAAGSSIGMIVGIMYGFYPFLRGKLQLKLVKPRFSVSLIRKIVSCGLPTFLSNIAGRITSIVMNLMLLSLGGSSAVGIYGVLMSADGLINPIMYGTCDSLQPAIGYNFGARLHKRVASFAHIILGSSGAISLTAFALLFMFSEAAMAIFFGDTADTALFAAGTEAVRLFSFTYLTRWISFSSQSFLSAIGRSREASMISVSVSILFPMLVLLALRPLALTGIWLNMPGTMLLSSAFAFFLFIRVYRKEIQVS